MAFGMHFINCKAIVFKEFRLPGYGVCTEMTCKLVDGYFGCLFEIDIQSREYIVPPFSWQKLVETEANEMWTSNRHDSFYEGSLAIR